MSSLADIGYTFHHCSILLASSFATAGCLKFSKIYLLDFIVLHNHMYYVAQFLLIFNWADYQPSRYGDYIYPTWADVIGWFMSFFVVVWIPVYAIYLLCKEHDGGLLKVCYNASNYVG
jgi:hypothetical protein